MNSGPALVLVHGSPGGPSSWDRVRAHLPPDIEVVTPTLADHDAARGAPPPPERSVDELAAGIEDQVDPDRAVVVAGWSFGGVVALAVGLRARLEVTSLVLVEPVATGALVLDDDPSHRAARAAAHKTLSGYTAAVDRGEPGAIATMVDLWFGAGAFGAMPERAQAALDRRAPVNARDVRAALATRYDPARLEGFDVPTIVAYGTASPAANALIAASLTEHLPGSRLVAIDGANHGLLDTHPAEVAELLVAALTAAGPPG